MTIQTWKNVPFRAAEHPYCEAFWPCSAAVSAGGQLPDISGNGRHLTLTNGATLNSNNMSLDMSTVGTLSAAIDLSGKDWIAAFSGKIITGAAAYVIFGPATLPAGEGQGLYFSGHNNFAATYNLIVGASGLAAAGQTTRVADANLHNQFAVYDASGNALTSIDGVLATPDADDAAASIGEIESISQIVAVVQELYAIAVFSWPAGSLPVNYENVMAWLFNEWRANRKVLPPMWIGT